MSFWVTWAYRSGELLDLLIEKVCTPQGIPVQVSPNPLDHSIQLNGFYSTSVQLGDPTVDNFKPFLSGVHRYVEENGGEFVYNMRAEKLVRDESGAVTGVIASDAEGSLVYYHASKGVIVCTGSYGHNKDMVSAFMAENVKPLFEDAIYNGYMDAEDVPSEILDVGDGHKMLCWAGARMEGDTHPYNGWAMSGVVGSPYLQVNQMGYRFMNESISFLNAIQQVVEQPNPNGIYTWQIITEGDGEMINTAGVPAEILKPFMENGDVYVADTIEELAESIDVPAAVFKETVDRYNEKCAAGFDGDFGKRAEYMIPVKTPPFRAIRVPYVVAVTCGGVICNKKMEVLDETGAAIPGLYAAGNTVGRRFGWAYEGSHVGLTNAIALMQGYLAAESAAAR